MTVLTPRDAELVALASAVASNCVPCVQHHIPEARKAGLTATEIRAAVTLADRVRRTPAQAVIDAAHALLAEAPDTPAAPAPACGCAVRCG